MQLWLPELEGLVDFTDPMHLALLKLLGVYSKREVLRARYRSLASMRAQVIEQGRNIGGRAPYGYRHGDAGPHPNKAQARHGRRLLRLEPDPVTAPHVRWIFAQRLAGQSVASLARELNERNVPCPSGYDRERDAHRSGEAWTLGAVTAILANPSYTGRQVWNRQPTVHNPDDHADDVLGRVEAQRWTPVEQWVVSRELAHTALVSEADFVAVQGVHTAPAPAGGLKRCFLLTGRLLCQECHRPLDANWVHGRSTYRCRHGYTSTAPAGERSSKQVYAREDQILVFLATHIDELRQADAAASLGYTLNEQALDEYLRDNELFIVCGYEHWTLHLDGEIIAQAAPPRMARMRTPRRPRRRTQVRRP